jgi:curved DNA-binding protein CbpA
MRTPYEELGVPEAATDKAIAARFRELAKALHPDVAGGAGRSDERFKRMTDAYNRLKTKDGRRLVDRELREGRERAAALHAAIERFKKGRAERAAAPAPPPPTPLVPAVARKETSFIDLGVTFARSRPPSERLWWIAGGTILDVLRASFDDTRRSKRRGAGRLRPRGGRGKGTGR